MCFYDTECDLGDGWEDPDVHSDSPGTPAAGLEMGANIVSYAVSGADMTRPTAALRCWWWRRTRMFSSSTTKLKAMAK